MKLAYRSYWRTICLIGLLVCLGGGILSVPTLWVTSSNTQAKAGAPVINNITPSQISVGTIPKKIIIDGTGFISGAKVEINGVSFPAKVSQGQRITLKGKSLPSMLFQMAGNLTIVVVNPDGQRSNPSTLVVQGGMPPPSRIIIQSPSTAVMEGGQLKLTAQVTNNQGEVVNSATFSFQSGSPEVATVDPDGTVRGIMRGYATITVQSGNLTGSTTLAVTRIESGPSIANQQDGEIRVDLSGNVYITDVTHQVLRRGQFDQNPTIFAGALDLPGDSNGSRLDARFNGPLGLGIDADSGAVYFADSANHIIRRLTAKGQVETIAGASGQPGDSDGSLASARFRSPRGVAVDRGGNIYVSDSENNTIRFIDIGKGTVTTLAGVTGQPGLQDGKGAAARFFRPQSIVLSESSKGFFSQGNSAVLLVADAGNKVIRQVTAAGDVTTIGAIAAPKAPLGTIQPTAVDSNFVFTNPAAVGRDDEGNIYVADNGTVRLITADMDGKRKLVDVVPPGVLSRPVGVAVLGTAAFVLDAGTTVGTARLDRITLGPPVISQVTPPMSPLQGGTELVIDGNNFSPETRVLFDGIDAGAVMVESATRIRLLAPTVNTSGLRNLSVLTRGGVAQTAFLYIPPAFSQISPGQITTVAGGSTFVGDGGDARQATLGFPAGLTVDSAGKLLIADTNNNRVRRVDIASRMILSLVGTGVPGDVSNGLTSLSAGIAAPTDVAIDSQGNFYTTNDVSVIKINSLTKTVTLVAGGNDYGDEGDGGQATAANLGDDLSLAFDSQDNLYIADRSFHRVRMVDAKTGIITTAVGNGMPGNSGDGGSGISAQLNSPADIVIDSQNNLYIADQDNNAVRRVDGRTGTITTFVNGNDQSGDMGLAAPSGLAIDMLGNLYIADQGNNRIRKVDTASGRITTIAGTGEFGTSGDGGLATLAQLAQPNAVAVDGVGNIFIADGDNNRIRQVTPNGQINTIIGTGLFDFSGDNVSPILARFFFPESMIFDNQGNLLVADSGVARIRKLDLTAQNVTTILGGPMINNDCMDLDCSAAQATFFEPASLAFDKDNNLLVLDSDPDQDVLRAVNNSRVMRIAGMPGYGFEGEDSPALDAQFATPTAVAVDQAGNIFIADTQNNRVRRIDAQTQVVTTVAGTEAEGFSGDGGPANEATMSQPRALAFDAQGNLYISDAGNHRIRRVDAQGIITTVVGTGAEDFSGDGGPATSAAITEVAAIVFDQAGNMYLADQFNSRVRRVSAGGTITTVAGNGNFLGFGDGKLATDASLVEPYGLAIDKSGNLYILDHTISSIRVVKGITK